MGSYMKPINANLLTTEADLTEGMNDRVKKYQQTLDEILQANNVACSFMDVKCLPLTITFKYKIESFTFKKSVLTEIEEMLPVYLNCQEAAIEFINAEMAFSIKISNDERPSLPLGNLLNTTAYKEVDSNTKYVLGIDKNNKPVVMDLLKSKNILILGDDEIEKSNMLKTIITSILSNAVLNTVNFRIIDSHTEPLKNYSDCKNFVTHYSSGPSNISGMFESSSISSARSITMMKTSSYNFEKYNEELALKKEVCPYLIVVVNNLEELLNQDNKYGKDMIRILQDISRDFNREGIYLICTAKHLDIGIPAKKIRDMFATRITFKKKEDYEDRGLNITYQSKLLGNGDGLYFNYKDNKFNSFQAATVTEDDIKLLVEYIETEAVQP